MPKLACPWRRQKPPASPAELCGILQAMCGSRLLVNRSYAHLALRPKLGHRCVRPASCSPGHHGIKDRLRRCIAGRPSKGRSWRCPRRSSLNPLPTMQSAWVGTLHWSWARVRGTRSQLPNGRTRIGCHLSGRASCAVDATKLTPLSCSYVACFQEVQKAASRPIALDEEGPRQEMGCRARERRRKAGHSEVLDARKRFAMLEMQISVSYMKGAPVAVDPQVLWQDIEAVTTAERLDGRRTQPLISKDSWRCAWRATCKGKARGWASGAQGIEWLTDDLTEGLRTDVVDWLQMPGNRKPNVWATGQASFIPKPTSREVEARRPAGWRTDPRAPWWGES